MRVGSPEPSASARRPASAAARQRHQIAHQVGDVLEIVCKADALRSCKAQTLSQSSGVSPTGRTPPCEKRCIRQRAPNRPRCRSRLRSVCAARRLRYAAKRPDIERCMRQVDWVRYLMTPEMRLLPSTRSTSPGFSEAVSAFGCSRERLVAATGRSRYWADQTPATIEHSGP